MSSFVRLEREEHVAVLHMENGPEGVLDAALVGALDGALDTLSAAPGALPPRVVMLSGTVPGVFVRRYDVDDFFAASPVTETARLPRLIRRLETMDAIVVAALNGTALGGGLELALGCDLRLASDGPFRIGFRETDVGLIPGAGGTQRLPRLLGVARALELVLLGKLLKPQEALAIGLVHQVLPRDGFVASARRFCDDLARRAPVALALAKRVIREGIELPLDEALRLESDAFRRATQTDDARGAVQAFAAGRTYTFRGQ